MVLKLTESNESLIKCLFACVSELISSDLLEILVDNTCLLLTSKLREIVKSALGFIKVLISAYQDTQIAGQLKRLVSKSRNSILF